LDLRSPRAVTPERMTHVNIGDHVLVECGVKKRQ